MSYAVVGFVADGPVESKTNLSKHCSSFWWVNVSGYLQQQRKFQSAFSLSLLFPCLLTVEGYVHMSDFSDMEKFDTEYLQNPHLESAPFYADFRCGL